MNDRLRGASRRTLSRVTPGSLARQEAARKEIEELRARVERLEEEVQEARRLNRRVAELLDIVEELLVPLSLRDEEKVRAYLEAHALAP